MQERVRAIIFEERKLLTLRRCKNGETYWVLPGGGLENDENESQALIRECEEELGVNVEVGERFFEYSYIHEKYGPQHEIFYFCKILSGELGTGMGPEFQPDSGYEGTMEIEWLEMERLQEFDLRPIEIKKELTRAYGEIKK